MANFTKGDRVSWNTSQGRTSGHVVEKRVSDFEKLDDWNVLEYECRGADCVFIVNGRIVNSLFKMTRPDPPVFRARGAGPGAAGAAAAPAGPPPPEPNFVPLDRGRIGIEVEYAEIWWRNLAIRAVDTNGA